MTLVVILFAYGVTSGCVTTLGYVPEHLKPANTETYIPTYAEVKKWAYDVVDGYDSRATMNRHALHFGALFAAAAAGALAGLAAFDAGHSAITGIPIGTAFLSGVFTIYSNEEKSQIYGYASKYVKDLITASDKRFLAKRGTTATVDALKKFEEEEAICLRDQVNNVMRIVAERITFLDPKNVAQLLKAVQKEQKEPKEKKETGSDTVTLKVPPADFRDINPERPLKIKCPED